MLDSWQQTSSRIAQTQCTHLQELLVHRAIQCISMDECDKKRGGCGTIVNYFHSAASIAQKDERKEERGHHDQPKSRTDCRGCLYQGERGRRMSEVRPRTSGLQHRFGTDSALPWMEPRRNTLYIDQSVPQRAVVPGVVAEYQPHRRRRFSEWFWWPRNTPKTRRWHTGSTSYKRLDGPGASFGGKPSLGTGTIRSMATSPSTVSASPVSTAARDGVDNGSLARATRGRRIHSGPVAYVHGNGSDWCETAQSNTTTESESMNHQQDGPVLTASHV